MGRIKFGEGIPLDGKGDASQRLERSFAGEYVPQALGLTGTIAAVAVPPSVKVTYNVVGEPLTPIDQQKSHVDDSFASYELAQAAVRDDGLAEKIIYDAVAANN